MAKAKCAGEVLLLTEKHGTIILDASSDAAKYRAALSVVMARFGGKTPQYPLHDPPPPVPPDVSEAGAEQFNDRYLKAAALEAWKRYKRELQFYNNEMEDNKAIRECIAKKDGKAAVRILIQRSGREYEGFQTDTVFDVYPTG